MKAIRNKVQLIGNLGIQPELKTLESGKTVVNFSMATNEKFRNQEGVLITDTQWHSIVAWGKTAEIIAQYVSHNILDLLNITRSCEGDFADIDYTTYTPNQIVPECGECFWCQERNWAKEKNNV